MIEFLFASALSLAPGTYICAEVQADLAKKPALRAMAEQAFGPLQFRPWSGTQPCAVPTAVLKFKSQTVLLSTAEPPYQAHACQATLTAHIFTPEGKGVKLSRVAKDFAKTGENCVAGTFKPLTIAGQDAFAVEGSGGGQGARAGWLEFYRFDGETIRQAKLGDLSCVWVDYRNAGALGADMENIRSSWRIGGRDRDRLFLDFTVIKPKSKAKTLKTEWSFGADGLKLVRGKTPEAFAEGACL